MTEDQIQRAVESIYENESLTEELDDDAAEFLLQWGEQQVRRRGEEIFEEARFEQTLHYLRRLMENLNYFIGQRENLDDEEAREIMGEIIQNAQILEFSLSPQALEAYLGGNSATGPQSDLDAEPEAETHVETEPEAQPYMDTQPETDAYAEAAPEPSAESRGELYDQLRELIAMIDPSS